MKKNFLRTALMVFISLVNWHCYANYILVVPMQYSTYCTVFEMDRNGDLLTPSTFSFPAKPVFGDADDFIISSSGKLALFSNFSCTNGELFRIDENNDFHFIQALYHESLGGGFSKDDQYFFSSTGFHDWPPPKEGRILVYKWNGSLFDIMTTNSVPTSATLTQTVVSTNHDEVFGSTRCSMLGSQSGGVFYQLDRQTNRLTMLKYLSPWTSGVDNCVINRDDNLIVYGGRQQLEKYGFCHGVAGTLTRLPSGEWRQNPIFRDDRWDDRAMIMGIGATPDAQYAVVFFGFTSDPPGGIWVLNINPDGSLSTHSNLAFLEGQEMAMTSDGKYIAIAWDFAQNISIVRLYPNGNLEEVYRIRSQGPAVGCMAFLPQALPAPITAANDACELYDGSRSSSPPISAKKSKPSKQSTNAAANGEWKRLKIDDRIRK